MDFLKIFLNNYQRKFPSINQLVIKKYIYRRVCSASKSIGNNIFLLPTDIPTEISVSKSVGNYLKTFFKKFLLKNYKIIKLT